MKKFSNNPEELLNNRLKSNYLNSNFFSKWNSDNAFVLGLIYADGDLLYKKGKMDFFLRIYSKEKHDLEILNNMIGFLGKIQERAEKVIGGILRGRVYFIHIADKNFIDDLVRIGMKYEKQLLTFPDIPENYYLDFISGFFSGKGTAYYDYERIRVKINFKSIELLETIRDILYNHGWSNIHIYANRQCKGKSHHIRMNLQDDCMLMYRKLIKGQPSFAFEKNHLKVLKNAFESN